jgi:YcaO-like protein with predicted kinase domain
VCRELLDKFAAATITVRVWDMTSDVGLPCFRCGIAESDQDPLHFGYSGRGFGCHPSRSVALSRALTEAAQGRLTYIAGSRDDVSRSAYDRMRNPSAVPNSPEPQAAQKRNYFAVPDWDCLTLADDLERELASLVACGIQRVIAVDLTREEFGIAVAKMVIPGLEGIVFEADYAPGTRANRARRAQTQ